VKILHVELPDKLAAEVETYVQAGWFGSEAEVVRAAVTDFIRRHRVELLERFMREDIEWALKLSKAAP
jgi:Arc/MetJ-type ribon-helix-helix transcriptional regulator